MSMQVMATSETTITVAVPFTFRPRNGRPQMVLPPIDAHGPAPGPDPKLLRTIARAWLWRRRLQDGEVATIEDIAREEGVTASYVGRVLRLAFLAPHVLEKALKRADATQSTISLLAELAGQPWAKQE